MVWAVRHFQCYLYGRHFQVITDCRPLKWLMNARDPRTCLARWNLLLQEYDLYIVHCAEKSNQNANTLSRGTIRGVETYVLGIDEIKYCESQREDNTLNLLIKQSENSMNGVAGKFCVDDCGLLYYWKEPAEMVNKQRGTAKKLVLKRLVLQILKVYHDASYVGLVPRKHERKSENSTIGTGCAKTLTITVRTAILCNTHKDPKN